MSMLKTLFWDMTDNEIFETKEAAEAYLDKYNGHDHKIAKLVRFEDYDKLQTEMADLIRSHLETLAKLDKINRTIRESL